MERQKKNKKKILNNQLLFDFETNSLTEHVAEENTTKTETKHVLKFKKDYSPIKKCHLKRKIRKV